MRRSRVLAGFIVAGGCLAAVAGQQTYAAEKKEVYVSPGAHKKTLVDESLPGVEGQQIVIDHYAFPPGWIGGKHYHTGPVYVYVLEGSFTIDEQGKERRTYNPGEVYREPIGTPMQARNLNAAKPLRVLVVQVGRKGEPAMIKAD